MDKRLLKKRPHEDPNQSSGPLTSQNENSPECLVTKEQPKDEKTKNWQMNLKVKIKYDELYFDWKLGGALFIMRLLF